MRAAIGLGSNLPSCFGDPALNLREALSRLSGLGTLVHVSSFAETEPVGYQEQPRFTNAVALLETGLAPLEVLQGLLRIEQAMGRVRAQDSPPKGPRIIDLDLLLYEDEQGHGLVWDEPELVLPHPELPRRAFVLQPLAEIAPTMQHPVLRVSVRELWERLREGSS